MTDMDRETAEVSPSANKNGLLGSFLGCYYGHSTDARELFISASGGLATALAKFALETRFVDGVVVVWMSSAKPLEPRVGIAHNAKELELAAQSKYCPVPLNIAINSLLREEGRFAIVGLPCHIQGMRRAERLIGALRAKIVLHIGLLCGHTVNFIGTEFLLQRFGIAKENVASLNYREGLHNGMTVKLKNGNRLRIPLDYYWGHFFSPNFFTPMRCTLCADFSNEFADLSLGDAWLPELLRNGRKESMIITRTKIGEQLIHRAQEEKKVVIHEISSRNIVRSSRNSILFKKKGLMARIRLLKILNLKVPKITVIPGASKPNALSYAATVLTYLDVYVSSDPFLRKILLYVPDRVIRLYGILIETLNRCG